MTQKLHDGSERRLSVMMITEGTYPYHWGGVSTWCHLLFNDLPNIDFTLLSLVHDPEAVPQFTLPENVVDFRPVPLWGLRELNENRSSLSLEELRRRRTDTTDNIITDRFVPIFRSFLEQLFADTGDPYDLALLVHGMHRFFLEYDFDTTLRSRAVWDCFVHVSQQGFPRAAAYHGYPGARFDLSDMTTCMQWLYHWLFPIGEPLPKTDVVHAAMAGICTLIAVAAKLEHGAPYMLTEHGIYLRERYLAEAEQSASLFQKIFGLRFALRMTELSYALSDQISPCCDYNQRWELQNGAKAEQLQTIYYGVDSSVFTPDGTTNDGPPVVVWVGRIDPLKDLLTLLRAAAEVHRSRPDIQFRLYGSAPAGNEGYYEKCLALQKELGLEDTVVFGGYRANPVSAFNEGDVVILSSVSEAFPFVILEAMLCAKPVVATAVGGVPEQINNCGLAVEPRNPEAMAEAILKLMDDPELRATLGQAARQKAAEEYSVRQSGSAHEASYRRLVNGQTGITIPALVPMSAAHNWVSHPSVNGTDLASAALTATTANSNQRRAGAHGNGNGTERNGKASLAGHDLLLLHEARRETAQLGGHVVSDTMRPVMPTEIRQGPAQPLTRQNGFQATQAAPIALLAAEVAQRIVEPIDSLETTAVIESMGITDAVAHQRYGAPDAFAVGEAVLTQIRADGLATRPPKEAPPPIKSTRDAILDYVNGPLALISALVILVGMLAYGYAADLTQSQMLALSAGLTGSLLLTNGFSQGISRRISVYLGLKKRNTAGHFLWRSLAVGGIGIVCVAALVVLIIAELSIVPIYEGLIFGVSFVALSWVWLLGGALSLVQKSWWLGLALTTGLVISVLVDRAIAPILRPHLALAAAVGFGVSMALLLNALRRTYTEPKDSKSTRPSAPVRLPSAAYLVFEAAPYFAYGTLYMVFILVPHIVGWFGAVDTGLQRMWAVTSVEVGLTVSMAPLILSIGVAGYAVRLFWRYAPQAQTNTPGEDLGRFGQSVEQFQQQQLRHYLLVLAALSFAVFIGFLVALRAGVLSAWLNLPILDQTLFIFETGLIAYGLLGWGLFNCIFVISVGRPQAAVRATLWGIAVTLVLGFSLSAIDFSFNGIAFICGAIAFVIASRKAINQVWESLDYHFVSTI